MVDKKHCYGYRNKKKRLRTTARGIMINEDFTKVFINFSDYYNDYTIPGGGMKDNESLADCLKRELKEEIGADSFEIIDYLGEIEESGIKSKDLSECVQTHHYFLINVTKFGETNKDDYEIERGIKAGWYNIDSVIEHNKIVDADKHYKDFNATNHVLEYLKEYFGI